MYRIHQDILTSNSLFWSEELRSRADKDAFIKLTDVSIC